MSRDLLILVSYVEAALLVVILSIGLNQVRKRLIIISERPGGPRRRCWRRSSPSTCAGLMGWVADINAPAAGHRRRAAGDRREGGARRPQGDGGLIA